APATTGGYPAIYIAGWVGSSSGNYGFWRSDNQGASWTQICKWRLNSLDAVKSISGDMNQYGRIYVGFGGSGYSYGDDGPGSTTPTASLSANPASISTGQSSTLSWSSANTTSCSGTNFTASGISGSALVMPSVTTTYSVTCMG